MSLIYLESKVRSGQAVKNMGREWTVEQIKNEIRKQTQVYLPAIEGGW